MKRILIMAVPIGSGHVCAAHAVEEELKKDGRFDVHYANTFDWVFPIYGSIYQAIYNLSVLHFRPLLKFFYNSRSIASASFHSVPKMHEILIYRLEDLFEAVEPDAVVATHFTPTHFASVLKSRYQFKLFVVVTDYHLHQMWLNPRVDTYFVAHRDILNGVYIPGWTKGKFVATGLPVRTVFEHRIPTQKARKLIGIEDDRPLVLIIGGRIFGGPWVRLVKRLIDLPINLIVLTGRNNRARRKINRLIGRGRARLKVFGLIENIHHFMMSADLVISKAGGLTTAESLVGKIPLTFANSLPGLERYNEEFFLAHDASFVIDIKKARTQVWDLLHDGELKKRIERFYQLSLPHPARNIVQYIKRALY